MAEFADAIREMAEKQKKNIRKAALGTLIDLSGIIIQRTPVDEGFTINAWVPSVGTPSSEVPNTADKTGQKAKQRAAEMIESSAFGDVFFLTNNKKWIRVLEYGLYPNPPKSGTGKTSGGYSKLAPQGMVRVTLLEFERIIGRQIDDLVTEG